MTAAELYALLEIELPGDEAMASDRLGVQVEPPSLVISGILTCLEVTDAVLDEAEQRGCNCIVTFHPLIFSPLESLRPFDRVGRCVMRAISSHIAIISVHTTLDAHPEGTNAALAHTLGIKPERPLLPSPRGRLGYGIGIVGRLAEAMPLADLVRMVAERLGTAVRYSVGTRDTIERIALVAGSGASFLDAAIESGADAFITADVKYHTFHRAAGHIALLDTGHFEMEQHVPRVLAQLIERLLARHGIRLGVTASSVRTSPVHVEVPLAIEIESSTTS
jgi:dinuclear metal center YbgI/SA1388 family protein